MLFQLLGLLISAGNQIASVNEVLLGEAKPQNSPSGSVQELASQGLKVFSAIHKRFYNSSKEEYNMLFALNAKYLKDTEYFAFHDNSLAIAREDFNKKDFDIFPIADPGLSSEALRIAQGNALIQLFQTPMANVLNPIEAVKLILSSLRIPNAESLLLPPNPNPEPSIEEKELMIKQQQNLQNAQLKAQEIGLKYKDLNIKEKKVSLESRAKVAKLLADAKKDLSDIGDADRDYQLERDKLILQAQKNTIERDKLNVLKNKP